MFCQQRVRASSALPLQGPPRGGVTLELVFALPLLLLALIAIVDFGGYYNDYQFVSSAADESAKARAAACGADLGQVPQIVLATTVAEPELIEIDQEASGSAPVRHYIVTLRYPRPAGMLSVFTQQFEELATIEVTAVAVCDPRCSVCN